MPRCASASATRNASTPLNAAMGATLDVDAPAVAAAVVDFAMSPSTFGVVSEIKAVVAVAVVVVADVGEVDVVVIVIVVVAAAAAARARRCDRAAPRTTRSRTWAKRLTSDNERREKTSWQTGEEEKPFYQKAMQRR